LLVVVPGGQRLGILDQFPRLNGKFIKSHLCLLISDIFFTTLRLATI